MTYSSPDVRALGDAMSLVRGGYVIFEDDCVPVCTNNLNKTECDEIEDED